MNGSYSIKDFVYPNTLTNNATRVILGYLTGRFNEWAGSIAVGVGSTAATTGDEQLDLEIYRVPITVKEFDTANSTVTVKGTIPTEIVLKVYEIGVFSSARSDSISIIDFDPDFYSITGATESTTYQRAGTNAIQISATSATTQTATLSDIETNYNDRPADSVFKLGYYPLDLNISSVELRLMDIDENYYSHTFSPSVTGYAVESWERRDMVNSGSASWANDITRIDVRVTAGGSDTDFVVDVLELVSEDVTDDFLISRAVLGSPFLKTSAAELDVEYTITLDL
jgi:hypothetical protein